MHVVLHLIVSTVSELCEELKRVREGKKKKRTRVNERILKAIFCASVMKSPKNIS